jgi:hypothetical protein
MDEMIAAWVRWVAVRVLRVGAVLSVLALLVALPAGFVVAVASEGAYPAIIALACVLLVAKRRPPIGLFGEALHWSRGRLRGLFSDRPRRSALPTAVVIRK